jgi:hypothetical protein
MILNVSFCVCHVVSLLYPTTLNFQKEEYSTILREQMSHIAIMRYLRSTGTNESELDPEQYCERGLESYQSKEKRSEIDVKRKLHQFLVIREQARQSILGAKDPELLRLMATQQSEGSLRKAQLRAALDQHEVTKASQQPLSEEEKLQVAMAQHQKILQAKQMQDLEDMAAKQRLVQDKPKSEQPAPIPQETEDPTNGIVTLASLWAQDDSSSGTPTQSSTELNALGSDIGMLKISSPSKSIMAQDFWKKPSKNGCSVNAARVPSHNTVFHQDAPMTFQASNISPTRGSYGFSGMQSQAIQNAFCSSFAHSADQQNHPAPSVFFHNSNYRNIANNSGLYSHNSNHHVNSHVASIMPATSALAAMNIQDTHQLQQRQHQVQQNPLIYASLLHKNSK